MYGLYSYSLVARLGDVNLSHVNKTQSTQWCGHGLLATERQGWHTYQSMKAQVPPPERVVRRRSRGGGFGLESPGLVRNHVMSRKTAVIVNPKSASGRTARRWPEIAMALRAHLGEFKALFTEGPGHGAELVSEALEHGFEQVISVGGDGTHSEVVNGLFLGGKPVNEKIEFAVVPTGTGGDLRRTLGLPSSPIDAIEVIGRDRRDVDVGVLEYTQHHGGWSQSCFINILSCGLSGRVAHELDHGGKALGGQLSFALAALSATARYRNQPVRIVMTDNQDEVRTMERTVYTLALANGQYFGGGMHVAPTASMNDGLLDVIVMGDMGWVEVVRGMVRVFKGRHLEEAKVEQFQARAVEIQPLGDIPLYLDVDGEQPGRLPVRVRLLPKALRVSVGPEAKGFQP